MDEKIVKKIMECEKKYKHIKIDIYSIDKKLKKYFIKLSIDVENIDIKFITIDVTENEYELDWIEYVIDKKINNILCSFYFIGDDNNVF